MTCDAIVAGHICLDIFPDLSASSQEKWEACFRPGQLLETGPVTLSTGGAVSNTGLVLHRLGIATRLMGKIGGDLLGRAIQQIVNSHGAKLADGMIVDEAAQSSYTIIINLPGVDRIFLHHSGPNDTFSAGDIRYDLVAGARLFHFGYPTLMKTMFAENGAQLVKTFRRVKEMGVTTSCDVSLPDPTSPAGHADWRAILETAMPYVDIFMPNLAEALFLLRGQAADVAQATPPLLSDLSGELLALGARIVGLKLGERGMYLRTARQSVIETLGAARPSDPAAWADRELWAPCFKVDMVGTTGAGDATIAGFLAALLRDMSPEEALTAAVAVGGCNVEASDALGGIRSWEETWQRIECGWARHPMTLDAAGWHFDDGRQLWVKPKLI
jgi:sugar/nucleoside kinase (ribokinase family)